MSLPVWARVASNRCLSRPAPLGASAKDQLDENKLHAQVCSGAMALPDAQQAMATDWYAAWQHYLATSGRRPPRRGHPLPPRHRHRAAAVLTRTARRLGRLAPPPCTVVIPAIGPGWTGTATASPASDGEPPSVQGCWSDRRLRQLSAQPARELAKLLNIAVPATPLGRSLSGVISTIETLTERRVLLRSLREGIDCSTLTGRMLAGIFAAPGGLREGAEARAGGSGPAARLAHRSAIGVDRSPGPAGPVAARRRGAGQRPDAHLGGVASHGVPGAAAGGRRGAAVAQCRHRAGMTAHAFVVRNDPTRGGDRRGDLQDRSGLNFNGARVSGRAGSIQSRLRPPE